MKRVKCKPNEKARLKGGRKSPDNKELMNRRVAEYRMWANGFTQQEIADKYGIARETVVADIKQIVALDVVKDVKDKITARYEEITRRALADHEKTNNVNNRVGYLRVASETTTRLSRLNGLELDTISIAPNVHVEIGGNNPYGKLSDEELEREAARRRSIVQARNKQKGKK